MQLKKEKKSLKIYPHRYKGWQANKTTNVPQFPPLLYLDTPVDISKENSRGIHWLDSGMVATSPISLPISL